MKPLIITPKEIDIIVASLGHSLIIWEERVDREDLPSEFDSDVTNNLIKDILMTYDKFLHMQLEMKLDLEERESLEKDVLIPDNILKFPG